MAQHPREQLSAYLDDALAPAERSALEAHLATCPACREELAQLGSVSRLIAGLPAPAPRRSLLPRPALPRWLFAARWGSSLAAAAFVVVFGISVAGVPGSGGSAARPAAAPQAASEAASAVPSPGGAQAAKDYGAAASAAPRAASTSSTSNDQSAFAVASPTPNDRAVTQPRGVAQSDRAVPPTNEELAVSGAWYWLGAAMAFAALALTIHLIIRSRRA